jgi:hypothetical protein
MFKGTSHEHAWLFYHNPLSLSLLTVAWMKEQAYLPEIGLHSHDNNLKQY